MIELKVVPCEAKVCALENVVEMLPTVDVTPEVYSQGQKTAKFDKHNNLC